MESNFIELTQRNAELISTDKLIDDLPKYLIYGDVLYNLLIYKHDWNGTHEDSYQVYYAKQTKIGFTTSKPLLRDEK